MRTKLLLVPKNFIFINRCKLHLKTSLFIRQTYFPMVINIPMILTNTIHNITKRYMTSITKKNQKQFKNTTDLDDVSDDEDDIVQDKRRKILNISVNSMRVDLVLKTGLGISRNKIDNAFFDKRIQKNGLKVIKKSEGVTIDDELDLIADKPMMNEKLITVSRITILDAILEDNIYRLKIMREKNLIVENDTKKF